MPDPTWTSLLPPLLAIGLAIGTRQVYLSLGAGVWLGYALLAGGPLAGLGRTGGTDGGERRRRGGLGARGWHRS